MGFGARVMLLAQLASRMSDVAAASRRVTGMRVYYKRSWTSDNANLPSLSRSARPTCCHGNAGSGYFGVPFWAGVGVGVGGEAGVAGGRTAAAQLSVRKVWAGRPSLLNKLAHGKALDHA